MPADKYDEVLLPFLALMRKELHANSRKGDRPGWLGMDGNTALLEVYWHTAKLSAAVKNNDTTAIIEHAADVANMAMMVLDVKVRIEHAAMIAGIRYGDVFPAGVPALARTDVQAVAAIREVGGLVYDNGAISFMRAEHFLAAVAALGVASRYEGRCISAPAGESVWEPLTPAEAAIRKRDEQWEVREVPPGVKGLGDGR